MLFAVLLSSLIVPIRVTVVLLLLLMRQFFATLPEETFDAARIDEVGPSRTYLFIALPWSNRR